MNTATEKLYNLYEENKKSHSKEYVQELLNQIELHAIESNTLSRLWIQEELTKIINKSKSIN
jgi:hypothetical protein